MKIKQETGFTLVELMVVIAMIGIIAGIGTVSTRDLRTRYRLKSAVMTLYSDLQMARLGAIRNGRIWSVCFLPGEQNFTSYTIGNAGGADNNICTAGDDPAITADPALFRKTVNLSSQSDIAFLEDFSGTRLTFDPRGSASTGNIELRPLHTGLTMGQKITVNGMTGNVSVKHFNLP